VTNLVAVVALRAEKSGANDSRTGFGGLAHVVRRVLGFGLARIVAHFAIGLPGRRGASGAVGAATMRHDWYIFKS